jgi:hypothetical protein
MIKRNKRELSTKTVNSTLEYINKFNYNVYFPNSTSNAGIPSLDKNLLIINKSSDLKKQFVALK